VGVEEALEAHEKLREAAETHHEREREDQHELFTRRAAVLVGVIAALLAIASLVGRQASNEVILSQERATDTYDEYQADSLKQRLGTNEGAILTALGQAGPAAAAQKDAIDKGARKDPLLRQARAYEAERDHAARKDDNFQVAEAAFQLGIVLISIGIVARFRPLAGIGAGLGAVGVVFLLNGVGPAIHLLP
jgi:hypothetical protein